MVATLLERRLTSRQAHLRDALVDLVLSQGFSQLTMDQFAAQLNCSKRSLYALASSKEQLAVLAVRHFFKRATDQVEAAIAHIELHRAQAAFFALEQGGDVVDGALDRLGRRVFVGCRAMAEQTRARARVAALGQLQADNPARAPGNAAAAEGRVEDESVSAGIAVQRIVAIAAVKPVDAEAAVDRVLAGEAK